MELKKLSEHIWYMPFEEERDRPNLGYVRGEKMSLAIDAGHRADALIAGALAAGFNLRRLVHGEGQRDRELGAPAFLGLDADRAAHQIYDAL